MCMRLPYFQYFDYYDLMQIECYPLLRIMPYSVMGYASFQYVRPVKDNNYLSLRVLVINTLSLN